MFYITYFTNPKDASPVYPTRVIVIIDGSYYAYCVLFQLGIEPLYPYPSGLLHWHLDIHKIVPVPVKYSWRIWVNISHNPTETMA